MKRLIVFCSLVILSLGALSASYANENKTLDQAIRLYTAKQYAASQPLFEQIVAAHPDNATAHYYLGRIYLRLKAFDKAIAHCKTSVELRADEAEHHFCLGRSYGEKARQSPFWVQAFLASKIRRAFEAAVAHDPKHVSARVGLTHFYMRAPSFMGGSLSKAREQAEKLIQLQAPQGKVLMEDIRKRQGKSLPTN